LKQLIQNLDSGKTTVVDVPKPSIGRNELLIQTKYSVISAGTEKMLLDFGKSSWLSRARKHPDKVEQVLSKIRTDGIVSTLETVQSKLDQPMPLGYSNMGIVLDKGSDVVEFEKGDRVLSNGCHAELVTVSKNLCCKVPDNVSDQDASFGVIASIALQSVRLADTTIGETFVVMGLGLVGLFAVQILKASGCKVVCTDFNSKRLEIARSYGAFTINLSDTDNLLDQIYSLTNGRGCDGVIIATATASSEPTRAAAQMCRKKGRIVLVGVAGLELRRDDFYEKELNFTVSCSYGPGRYDDSYELDGIDYPYHYVRWSEQRNFGAVLDLMSEGRLVSRDVVTHEFELENAPEAYELLSGPSDSLGISIKYSNPDAPREQKIALHQGDSPPTRLEAPEISVIGAGNYARAVLIPSLAKTRANLHTLVSEKGLNAAQLGQKYKFSYASSEPFGVIEDDSSDAIVIATQHNFHAQQVVAALKSGKSVFCEKPLCLTLDEYEQIKSVKLNHPEQILMVGFNRRYAPYVNDIKKVLDQSLEPKMLNMTINAGSIENDHWIQDPHRGGGRIIGEACHFIDLMRYLVGCPFSDFNICTAGRRATSPSVMDDFVINFKFEDGSLGVINYFSQGSKQFSKERIECFTEGRVIQLDNFQSLRIWGSNGKSVKRRIRQDKGQQKCLSSFVDKLCGEPDVYMIPTTEIFEVTKIAIELSDKAT
jgi:predicted dehydrogenase/threonine dehydrogenase-like Zn-dependent dehydrogenase